AGPATAHLCPDRLPQHRPEHHAAALAELRVDADPVDGDGKAASLDLAFYEDPASYDLLRRAQTDSINRPVQMISTAFGLVQTTLTFITMIALLVAVSPLLALLALLSPIPAFIADTRYGWRGYNIARWG